MTTRTDTWMPLYIGDYIADTMHLNGAQHGAYLLMIMHYWRQGPLPNNDEELAGIARTDKKTWLRDVGPIVRKFFSDEGTFLRHKRIDLEMERAAKNSSRRRDAANSRWKKTCKRNANASGLHDDSICKTDDPRGRLPSPRKKDSELRSASGVAPEPPDARRELRTVGVSTLQAMTGLPGPKTHALIGKLLKDCGDNCAIVLGVLKEAAEFKPAGDPVAWIVQAVKARSSGLKNTSTSQWSDVLFPEQTGPILDGDIVQ